MGEVEQCCMILVIPVPLDMVVLRYIRASYKGHSKTARSPYIRSRPSVHSPSTPQYAQRYL